MPQTTPLEPRSHVLAVGVGSPHGDDQIGWIVVRALASALPQLVEAKTIRQPAELLDLLDSVDELIVCDACQSGGRAGELHRWTWPTHSLATFQRSGSHDLTLPFVLTLAERLGKLPPQVIVWGIELDDALPGDELGDAVKHALPGIVQTIADDVRDHNCRREECRHA